LKSFHLDFFGGEPQVAWDVVIELASELCRICDAAGTDMRGSMTTNGILLDRGRLQELVDKKVTSFQITLDGPKAVHDLRRVTRQGKGSFDAVWKTLEMIKASPHDVEVLVRMHFDPNTIDLMLGETGLIKQVATSLVQGDNRFRLHFHPLGRWGGPNDKDISVFKSAFDEQAAIETLVAQALAAGCLPDQLDQYRHDAVVGESGHMICYAARSNAFVIRSDGRVAKCTVAFEDDRNTVGKLSPNGDLIIDHARHLPWLEGLISGDPLALTCPALGYLWRKSPDLARAV
jgi:uncharacterized protein